MWIDCSGISRGWNGTGIWRACQQKAMLDKEETVESGVQNAGSENNFT